MAHIKGKKKGSSRYDKTQSPQERDDYINLLLLCPTHHTVIDKKENESIYTVGVLLDIKHEHEAKIIERLKPKKLFSVPELKKAISIYLHENKQTWLQYGPLSEVAKKNPHSQEIYSIWYSERLTTIIPNNRRIVNLLESYRQLFDPDAQEAISQFLTHAKSYEKWVNDEIPYNGVLRFPLNFEYLILRS